MKISDLTNESFEKLRRMAPASAMSLDMPDLFRALIGVEHVVLDSVWRGPRRLPSSTETESERGGSGLVRARDESSSANEYVRRLAHQPAAKYLPEPESLRATPEDAYVAAIGWLTHRWGRTTEAQDHIAAQYADVVNQQRSDAVPQSLSLIYRLVHSATSYSHVRLEGANLAAWPSTDELGPGDKWRANFSIEVLR